MVKQFILLLFLASFLHNFTMSMETKDQPLHPRLAAYKASRPWHNNNELLAHLQQIAAALLIQDKAITLCSNTTKAMIIHEDINKRLRMWLPVEISRDNASEVISDLQPHVLNIEKNIRNNLFDRDIFSFGSVNVVFHRNILEPTRVQSVAPSLAKYSPTNAITSLEGICCFLKYSDLIAKLEITRDDIKAI